MRILITGSTALLGPALIRRFAKRHEVTGLSRRESPTTATARHVICDLTDFDAVSRLVDSEAPEAVIHCQALSDVDRCEREPAEATRQNVDTLVHLVRALERCPALLVVISTDYVFEGRQRAPYTEDDPPRPLNVYGRSKLAGEQAAVRHPRTVIVRLSTLFGPDRANFCHRVVDALKAGQSVAAFEDQVTSPSYTGDVAEGLEALVEQLAARPDHSALPKTYHMANAGACRRVEFARRIAELLGAPAEGVRAVRMTELHLSARRPPYSALDSGRVAQVIGWRLRPWDDALQAYLRLRRWLN